MKYVFGDWDKLESRFLGKPLALFLDYDGTITALAKTPDKAVLSPETKGLLKKLIKNPKRKLAFISGRALDNLKRMVGISDVTYVGNHGLEIEGPKIRFKTPVSPKYRKTLRLIKDDLTAKLSTVKGAFVEDKELSLSVHYRLVDRSEVIRVKTIFHEATILYKVRGEVAVKQGKEVFEILPPVEWDKGKVVLWLFARWSFSLGGKDVLPVYLGDDTTDEDAFKALRKKGITIFIGEPKKSNAQYYLNGVREVKEFLNRIAQLQ